MIFLNRFNYGAAPLFILVVVAVLLYVAYETLFTPEAPVLSRDERMEYQQQITDRERVTKEVKKFTEKGIVVEINVERNRAWIKTALWTAMDIEQKQGIIRALSKYFDYQGSLSQVYLYDSESGKKIGSFSLWEGIKFY